MAKAKVAKAEFAKSTNAQSRCGRLICKTRNEKQQMANRLVRPWLG